VIFGWPPLRILGVERLHSLGADRRSDASNFPVLRSAWVARSDDLKAGDFTIVLDPLLKGGTLTNPLVCWRI
jgi:hypothetical protein